MEKIFDDNIIRKLADYVVKKKYKNIAVQFSDEFLQDSPVFSYQLKSELEALLPSEKFRVYLIADSASNSGCCVDVVSARHYCTDCIVQYGHSCLSPIKSEYQVINVFAENEFNKSAFELQCFKDTTLPNQSILLISDTSYTHVLLDLLDILWSTYSDRTSSEDLPEPVYDETNELSDESSIEDNWDYLSSESQQFQIHVAVPYSEYNFPQLETIENQLKFCNRYVYKYINGKLIPLSDRYQKNFSSNKLVLYIGGVRLEPPSFLLTLALRYLKHLYLYNTTDSCFYTYKEIERDIRRVIQKRYGVITASEKANRIVLLRGTVPLENTVEIYSRLKRLCEVKKKFVVSIVIGKINVPKLENFVHADAFCLISCPESSFLPNPKDYSKPILTPFELEILLGFREWSLTYQLHFSSLLKKRVDFTAIEKPCSKEESRVTLLHSGELIPLRTLSYKGVPYEKEGGFSDEIVPGRAGIACCYDDESCYQNKKCCQ